MRGDGEIGLLIRKESSTVSSRNISDMCVTERNLDIKYNQYLDNYEKLFKKIRTN